MPEGIALTIGLNAVDPKHYGGWSGELNACEADANDMAAIARGKTMHVTSLLRQEATRDNVMKAMNSSAGKLKGGDLFILSYSGHGGQLPDRNNDEDDGQDETWCLYDGELVDDELYGLLANFSQGVRILVFSDSCHSGTVTKLAYHHGTASARTTATGEKPVYRAMPPEVALRTYRNNKDFYDTILKDRRIEEKREAVKASVLLFSGCQDNQLSLDGAFNGLFTSQLLRVWNNSAFKGNYRKFHKQIVRLMPPEQTPNFFRVGVRDTKFEGQAPFTV